MLRKKENLFSLIFFLVALLASIVILHGEYNNSLEIFYYGINSSAYDNDVAKLYWTEDGNFSEDDSVSYAINKRHAMFSLPNTKNEKLPFLRVDFSQMDRMVSIESVQFRSGWKNTCEVSGKELLKYVDFYNVKDIVVYENHIDIQPSNDDAYFIFKSSFLESNQYIFGDKPIKLLYLAVIWIIFIGICFVLYNLKKHCYTNKYYYCKVSLLLIAIACIVLMALLSVTYGHPDEDETVGSINYYIQNWKLPNFADSKLYNIFSNYGTTRLVELSVYYLLAGKISFIAKNIFHIFCYYRIWNVGLFILLFIFFCKYGKKNPWLSIPLIITPQVWYLYSYATSDAWDYFLSFILIGMICIENGKLNQILDQKINLKNSVFLCIYGIIFGFLGMGKKNFYIIFVLAFVIFLFKLIEQKKASLLLKYLIIVAAFCITIFIRWSIDYAVYDGTKEEQYNAIRQEHIIQDNIPGGALKEKYLSLREAYTESEYGKAVFESFTGCYGWRDKNSGVWYYRLIFVLYICFVIILARSIVKQKNVIAILRDISVIGVVILSYVICFYNSWSFDFQPQGRYLFPAIFAIMYLGYEHKELFSKKSIKMFGVILLLISLYSFVRYGCMTLFV